MPSHIVNASSVVELPDGRSAVASWPNEAGVQLKDSSVLLGTIFETESDCWADSGTENPDGNYAIIRSTDERVEILSDYVGSRTIWYAENNDVLLVSTSQLAIVSFLQDFKFDERVIPWVMSTGTLGPELSWDSRVQRVPPNTRISFDKTTYEKEAFSGIVGFNPLNWDAQYELTELESRLRTTIRSLNGLDFEQWVLPISGGYDSRAIACLLNEELDLKKPITSLTWGSDSAQGDRKSDASVAADVAASMGLQHEYVVIDESAEPVDTVLERYMLCSEGRIDHISGYMDGLKIWKILYDADVAGTIRGDEGFGWAPVSSELTTRLSLGCGLCADYDNLSQLHQRHSLPPQELPDTMAKGNRETLGMWRDRLYHEYRIPSVLAALSDVKFSYVEQINPLLSRRIISHVRTMSDTLRTDKTAFRQIVNKIAPDIRIASRDASRSERDILRSSAVKRWIEAELSCSQASDVLPSGFLDDVRKGIANSVQSATLSSKLKRKIARLLPRKLKNRMRDTVVKPRMDSYMLAFRVAMIIKTYKLFSRHAAR